MSARALYWLRSAAAIARHTRARHRLLPLLVGRPGALAVRGGPELSLGHAIDALVWKEVWLDDEYGLGALRAPGPDALVVDVGAGIGLFATAVARALPDVRILACEPDPRQTPRLRANLARTGAAARTCVVERAVSTAPRVWLQQRRAPATNTTATAPTPGALEVPAIGLGDLLARARGPVALLKLDCEGAEAEALASLGAEDWSRIARLAIETHEALVPGITHRVEALLQTRGYTVVRRPDAATCLLHARRREPDTR